MYKISASEVDKYRDLLEKRIQDIETVIEGYFQKIKPNLIAKKIAKIEEKGF